MYFTFALLIAILLLWPVLFFLYSYFTNNFTDDYIDSGFEYTGETDGFRVLPEFKGDSICDDVQYLGQSNVFTDCSKRCGGSTKYEYIYIEKDKNVIVNGKKLEGSYCAVQSIAQCNLNTSHAIVGTTEYSCISKFGGIFGGESGNEILACNGKLNDGLFNETFINYIPTNLTLNSIDEKLPNGKFRFTCFNEEDTIPFKQSLGSRLETDFNVCTFFDKNGKFDTETFQCKCDKYTQVAGFPICTSCKTGFASSVKMPGAEYAFTLGRECVDPKLALNTKLGKFACGPSTIEAGENCEHAVLLASNSYTPYTLERIFH